MRLQLITLDGTEYDADAYSVVLPTAAGQITVMNGHEPLMSALVPGVISIRKDARDSEDKVEHYATYGGVVEVTKNGPRVLVDEANTAGEIVQAEAERAYAEAQRMLAGAKSRVELEQAQALVDRQAVRLQVADLRRRHSRR
ncbi:MAG TPA: ATP synthase F1 subunit epsilon [Candidatus Saccharimonadales bacterium]|nr:ATP synthase F1 subunit epsilon [Candidatus Saccharimonadales bacterium]